MSSSVQMSEVDKSYYRGVLTALQHIFTHDEETIFNGIIKDAGIKSLVEVATEEDALEWSGLVRYGYATK
jgi:hypothetical protein